MINSFRDALSEGRVGGIELPIFLYADSVRINPVAMVSLYPFEALQPVLWARGFSHTVRCVGVELLFYFSSRNNISDANPR